MRSMAKKSSVMHSPMAQRLDASAVTFSTAFDAGIFERNLPMLKFRKEVTAMSLFERQYGNAPGFEGTRPDAELTASDWDHLKSALRPRLAFLGACALAGAAATLYAGTGGVQSADPDLAKLLKGMAIIKTAILLAVGTLIWWRLGSGIRPIFAAGYIIVGAIGVAGAALVWNMAGLGLAPFLFDGGLLGFLILALRDDNGPWLRALTRARRA
jgi:hypothetical protein